jgi:hypothetical protein
MQRQPWTRVFLGLALSVLLASASFARADAPLPDCHVIAVGVDDYSKESKQNKLKGCRNDAKNLAARLTDQGGKLFGKVHEPRVLTDDKATLANVEAAMSQLRNQGKAGDWVVLVLSGHGGVDNSDRWSFVTQEGKLLTDRAILAWSDALAAQGKKVWIIVDACQSGQLRHNAQEILERYQDEKAGGILLMVASSPRECGQALGNFSSFAQSVNEALMGDADLNGDGFVTLREVRHYAYHRTYELTRQFNVAPHDGECVASMSIADNVRLAAARTKVVTRLNSDLTNLDPVDPRRAGSHSRTIKVLLVKGQTYTIDLKSTAFDPYLRLENGGGVLRTNDDVGGGNRNSKIVYTAAETGCHLIVVTSYAAGRTGAFTLTIKQGS